MSARPTISAWPGDHPGLDLVNTETSHGRGDRIDLMGDWVGLVAWAEAAGLIDPDGARQCRASSDRRRRTVLAWVRRLRSALRAVLEAGESPAAARALDAAVAGVSVRLRYRPGGIGRPLDAAGPIERLRLALATAALDAAGIDRSRVRGCANPRCNLLFHDTTKNGSRRWCSMATCGNRAKARAHYRRSRHPGSARRRAVVLVEGASDQAAVEALAARRGRDLASEGVEVVPMGGAKNIRHFLERYGPQGSDVRLAGLCDAAEERDFRRGLERVGLGSELTRADIESLGFYVCVADLEDELIRSLGATAVEQVVEAQGELASFRTFQKQPAQQGRAVEQQLRRFMGTRSGRKVRYATLLVDALDLGEVPRPLDGVLAHV